MASRSEGWGLPSTRAFGLSASRGTKRTFLTSRHAGLNRDEGERESHFQEVDAQRLMQALGAYGFLGIKKGLKAYLDYIPSGLYNLLLTTKTVSLPRLQELSRACQSSKVHKV